MTHQQTDVHHLASASVVVGVDGSDGAGAGLDWAAGLAARRGRDLHILHGTDVGGMRTVFNCYDVSEPPVFDAVHDRAAALVDRARRRAVEVEPALRVSTEVSEESAARVLVRHSATAYLVVLGASGTSGLAANVGSTLLAVTSHAGGTVAVVRTDPDAGAVRGAGPVVVGVDGSAAGEAAIGAAFEEASERRAELVAVHMWNDLDLVQFAGDRFVPPLVLDVEVGEQAILAERMAGWPEKYPDVSVVRKVYPSDPRTILRAWSRAAQLVVVGTRGRGGFRGLLFGSTSNFLVQHAYCPVMVVHPAK